MNKHYKHKLIVEALNKDIESKNLPAKVFSTGLLANLPEILMELTLKYNEDFVYRASYGKIKRTGLFLNKLSANIHLSLNDDEFIIRETITTGIFNRLKVSKIQYKKLNN